jgi:hypothetical protein
MQDFEKLGVFYLGRLYDVRSKTGLEDLLLYDSKEGDDGGENGAYPNRGSGDRWRPVDLIDLGETSTPASPGIERSRFRLINEEDAQEGSFTAGICTQADLWRNGL